jgi:hypothetical protein
MNEQLLLIAQLQSRMLLLANAMMPPQPPPTQPGMPPVDPQQAQMQQQQQAQMQQVNDFDTLIQQGEEITTESLRKLVVDKMFRDRCKLEENQPMAKLIKRVMLSVGDNPELTQAFDDWLDIETKELSDQYGDTTNPIAQAIRKGVVVLPTTAPLDQKLEFAIARYYAYCQAIQQSEFYENKQRLLGQTMASAVPVGVGLAIALPPETLIPLIYEKGIRWDGVVDSSVIAEAVDTLEHQSNEAVQVSDPTVRDASKLVVGFLSGGIVAHVGNVKLGKDFTDKDKSLSDQKMGKILGLDPSLFGQIRNDISSLSQAEAPIPVPANAKKVAKQSHEDLKKEAQRIIAEQDQKESEETEKRIAIAQANQKMRERVSQQVSRQEKQVKQFEEFLSDLELEIYEKIDEYKSQVFGLNETLNLFAKDVAKKYKDLLDQFKSFNPEKDKIIPFFEKLDQNKLLKFSKEINEFSKLLSKEDENVDSKFFKQGDYLQDAINRIMGLNELPTVVSQEELDQKIKAKETEILKGFKNWFNPKKRSQTEYTGIELFEQYKNGFFITDAGIFGNGCYGVVGKGKPEVAASAGASINYYKERNVFLAVDRAFLGSCVMRMSLAQDAKNITLEKLTTHHESLMKHFKEKDIPKDVKLVLEDPGRLASLLGYDAIAIPQDNTIIILNRGKTTVQNRAFGTVIDVAPKPYQVKYPQLRDKLGWLMPKIRGAIGAENQFDFVSKVMVFRSEVELPNNYKKILSQSEEKMVKEEGNVQRISTEQSKLNFISKTKA